MCIVFRDVEYDSRGKLSGSHAQNTNIPLSDIKEPKTPLPSLVSTIGRARGRSSASGAIRRFREPSVSRSQ
jgi:hypothetical protein